jgi:uncharacterized protein
VLDLVLLPDDYAVCRLEPGVPLPSGLGEPAGIAASVEPSRPASLAGVEPSGPASLASVEKQSVVSVTWSPTETSIICPADQAPSGGIVNAPWRCFRVNGPVNLALTGILASLVNPLADARVNVFAFSTHDTDYLLVPSVRLAEALGALTSAGHRVATPDEPPSGI